MNNNFVKLSPFFTFMIYFPGLGLKFSKLIMALTLSFTKVSEILAEVIFFLSRQERTVTFFFNGTATAINKLVFILK